jgi:ABC-type uncharacterized transport system ATPase subunit
MRLSLFHLLLLLLLLQVAVCSLNLAIKQGECFGLLGPNGAGERNSPAQSNHI